MTIDDRAGRKAVRERRAPSPVGEGTFVAIRSLSRRSDAPVAVTLRDDLHRRATEAAKRVLRSRRPAKAVPS